MTFGILVMFTLGSRKGVIEATLLSKTVLEVGIHSVPYATGTVCMRVVPDYLGSLKSLNSDSSGAAVS